MNELARGIGFTLLGVGLGLLYTCSKPADGQVVSDWQPSTPAIAYGFRAQVDRFTDAGAAPDTVLTVGAQVNAINRRGVNQIAFGIATEAWAEQGSISRLVGLEASVINREPENWIRKIGLWSTFKNRPDTEYFAPPADPANMDAQALRIESQPGTGWSRGIVFARDSLAASRDRPRPAALDFSELADLEGVDLIRFPDGCALIYVGRGQFTTRCEP